MFYISTRTCNYYAVLSVPCGLVVACWDGMASWLWCFLVFLLLCHVVSWDRMLDKQTVGMFLGNHQHFDFLVAIPFSEENLVYNIYNSVLVLKFSGNVYNMACI